MCVILSSENKSYTPYKLYSIRISEFYLAALLPLNLPAQEGRPISAPIPYAPVVSAQLIRPGMFENVLYIIINELNFRVKFY